MGRRRGRNRLPGLSAATQQRRASSNWRNTYVTWVDLDGKVNGKAYSADELDSDAVTARSVRTRSASSTLTVLLRGESPISPPTSAIASSRRVVTASQFYGRRRLQAPSVLQGRHFSVSDEQGGEWVARDLSVVQRDPGFHLKSDFQVLGWSGEDGIVIISYEIDGAANPVVQSVSFDADAVDASYSSTSDVGGTSRPVGSSSSFVLSLQSGGAHVGPAESGATAESTAPAKAEFTSLHAGIVDVAGTGGRLLIGDGFTEQDGVAGFSAGDGVVTRDDDITGTQGDDIILGDLA